MRLGLPFLCLSVFAGRIAAQPIASDSARIAQILRIRDSIEKESKTFHFGLSLGWRHIIARPSDFYRDAVIDPTTNLVAVDTIDQGDVVLSGTLAAYPFWRHSAKGQRTTKHPFGFLANINIASFNSDNLSAFNKSIEGGGGVAWRLADDFALALTLERLFSRRLRSFVLPGQMLLVKGDTITSLSRDDGRFFRDDNLTAASFKFVYSIR